MLFQSRQDAGRQLGNHLASAKLQADVILGLPRGGVIVAAAVAAILHRPLDVLVVRKIGHPRFREFAVGALAEGGVVVLDAEELQRSHVDQEKLNQVIAEEKERLGSYRSKFARHARTALENKSIVLVDDGLATGSTLEAAVRSVRQHAASRVTVAVPVASASGYERLAAVSDEMIVLHVDPAFEAVGQYYSSFPQTTDDEVLQALSMG